MTENQHNAIKEFQEIRNIRNEKYMIFVKTITTIAVGFLGILLSLADTEKMSCIKHLFYSLLTSTTALGILCSLIVLYGEIASLTILMNNHHNKLLKQVEEGSDKMRGFAPGVVDGGDTQPFRKNLAVLAAIPDFPAPVSMRLQCRPHVPVEAVFVVAGFE